MFLNVDFENKPVYGDDDKYIKKKKKKKKNVQTV